MTWVILGGIVVGAGLGAATSAATGGDPGKGALFGAIGGGLTGGIGSLAGSAMGSAASSATGALEGTVGGIANAGTPAVASMFPSGATSLGSMVADAGLGAAPEAAVSGLFPAGAQTLTSVAGGGIGSTLGSIGTQAVKSAVPDVVKAALPSPGMSPEMIRKGQEAQAWNTQQENKQAEELGSQVWGLAPGKASGGEINLEDGQFIFPADVVSAIGNGSTKAGAQFLDEFFGLA